MVLLVFPASAATPSSAGTPHCDWPLLRAPKSRPRARTLPRADCANSQGHVKRRMSTGGHGAAHAGPCRVPGRPHGPQLEATLDRALRPPAASLPANPARGWCGLRVGTLRLARTASRPPSLRQPTCRPDTGREIPFAQPFAAAHTLHTAAEAEHIRSADSFPRGGPDAASQTSCPFLP